MNDGEVNYNRLYCFVFNAITDLIYALQAAEHSNEETAQKLMKIQQDAEEMFIG
jgi:hypothetical protein